MRQQIPCFSAVKSEPVEVNRKEAYELLDKAGLPVPTYRGRPVWEQGYITGINAAREALKNEKDKFIKTAYYRQDMETYKYLNSFLSNWWFDERIARTGEGHEDFEVIIEDMIESCCEGGYDTPMLNGDIPKNIMIGYEAKDSLYGARIVETLPKVMLDVHNAKKSIFKERGYQAWYSTEMRFDKNGVPHPIDDTIRLGSPPNELYIEQYTTFPQNVWDLANGVMPVLKPQKEYGFLIALWVEAGCKRWAAVQYPDDIAWAVKLKNSRKVKQGFFVLPKDKNGDIGAVIGLGKTLLEAKTQAFEHLKLIKCDLLEHGDEKDYIVIEEAIKAGEKFGIKF